MPRRDQEYPKHLVLLTLIAYETISKKHKTKCPTTLSWVLLGTGIKAIAFLVPVQECETSQ